MEKLIYEMEQYHTSKWSGGITTEFAIFPASARYLERDFIWRLSSASVDAKESTFTKLPDYDRILMVLEGEAVLAHADQRTVKLAALEQDSFDGAVKTSCFGQIKDYNLMTRKGCRSRMFLMDAEAVGKPVEKTDQAGFSHGSYGFYCLTGYAVVSLDGENHMVPAGSQMVVNFDEGEYGEMTLMGEGKVIVTEIFYDRHALVAEVIPEEKATFEDFKAAFRLSHHRNKWSGILGGRKQEKLWYDEALQEKLRFLDRSCIGLVLWVVVTGFLAASAALWMSHGLAVALVVLWTIIHNLLVSPVIYLFVLPKPIKSHMKQVQALTPYERKLYEEQAASNPELEKLLKKYKYSGRDWDGEYESLFSRFKK